MDDVLLDPAAAHPELGVLRSALTARDWSAARAVLDAAVPAGRTCLMHWVMAEPGLDSFLRYFAGGDTTAAALLAFHLIDTGWKVRSRAQAKHVTAEQFAAFHGWLRQAEALLIDAAAAQPADPAVWTARLLTARGLQLGAAETRRRYDRLVAADPHHYPGQAQFLQSLCPKWSGTWAELHGWAWAAMTSSPPGSPQGALVAEAFIEHRLEKGGDRSRLRPAAEHSVWHPAFRRDPGWVPAASAFAMAFGLAGDAEAAGRTFALLGPYASARPWDYLGTDVPAVVRKQRHKAMQGVR